MSDLKTIIKYLEHVVDYSEADLHKAAKKEEYTPEELETVKNIAKIAYYRQVLKAMDEAEDEEGYSERGGYSQRGGYARHYAMYPYSYTDGMSYARGQMRNGRYSRYGGNSYRNSYSMEDSKAIVMDKLEEAMNNTMNENERQAIEEYLNKLSM